MSFEMDNLMHQIGPTKKPRKREDSGRGVCSCNSLITRTAPLGDFPGGMNI